MEITFKMTPDMLREAVREWYSNTEFEPDTTTLCRKIELGTFNDDHGVVSARIYVGCYEVEGSMKSNISSVSNVKKIMFPEFRKIMETYLKKREPNYKITCYGYDIEAFHVARTREKLDRIMESFCKLSDNDMIIKRKRLSLFNGTKPRKKIEETASQKLVHCGLVGEEAILNELGRVHVNNSETSKWGIVDIAARYAKYGNDADYQAILKYSKDMKEFRGHDGGIIDALEKARAAHSEQDNTLKRIDYDVDSQFVVDKLRGSGQSWTLPSVVKNNNSSK